MFGCKSDKRVSVSTGEDSGGVPGEAESVIEDGEDGDGDSEFEPNRCDSLIDSYVAVSNPTDTPPQWGTVWFSSDILTDADPSAFVGLISKGQGERVMYDRRTASFETFNAHLFDATFGTDTVVEIQVNPEFSADEAEAESLFYAGYIGKMPGFLFADLDTVWIHRGLEGFGGGNNNLLIHTEQGQEYLSDGVLEEVFIHEGAHTSLDAYHGATLEWEAAQVADGQFISNYAADYPQREDVAESLGPYLAYRYRPERISTDLLEQVASIIPNRTLYFDCLNLSLDPLQ